MQKLRDLWYRFKSFDRKHQIAILLVLVAVLGSASVFAYTKIKGNDLRENPDPHFSQHQEPEPVPATKPSLLTGQEVSPEAAARAITGVMIENSPEARPQSGLHQAGIVFEAVAEGGITRFLALYQDAKPSIMGPVRSLRPYYLDWAMSFDAAIAHVGGSADALHLVKVRNAKDLDQYGAGASYWRSSDRYAPHNVYTSAKLLDALQKSRGYTKSTITPFERKDDAPSATPTAIRITTDFSGPLYKASWTWDKANNAYSRKIAGATHKDRESGQTIRVKNVVVLKMPTTYSGKYAVMDTTSSGSALVFRDGTVEKATWRLDRSLDDRLTLRTAEGEVKLNKGKTWFAVVPSNRPVNYAAR